jgi:predicted permease
MFLNLLIERCLRFVVDLLLPVAIGYVLVGRTSSVVSSVANAATTAPVLRLQARLDRVMWANIYCLTPVLTCLAFWSKDLQVQDIWLPVMGLVQQVVPLALGWWRSRKFDNPADRGSYLISSAFANRSVVGIISVWILYGQDGYATARWVMLAGPFVFYFFGFALARHFRSLDRGQQPSFSMRGLLFQKNQLPLLGIAAGIALNMLGVPRHAVLDRMFDPLVHISAWLFMVPIGASLDFGEMRRYLKPVSDLLVIRFVITPVICLALVAVLGMRGEAFGVVMVLAFTPASIGAVILTRLYKLNVHVAAAAYVVTLFVYFALIFPLILLVSGLSGAS